jgi:hypothetical protein
MSACWRNDVILQTAGTDSIVLAAYVFIEGWG